MDAADKLELRSPTTGFKANSGAYHPRWFLVAFYLLAVVWGVRNVHREAESRLDILVPFGLSLSLGSWAVADASHRRRPIPLLARPWFVLAGALLVPLYTISSRGWRGAGWIILNVVAWFALATVTLNAILYGLFLAGALPDS